MFLLYHPLWNGREDTFVYWVGHLDVFSLISSYRVELFLLHLKVIDGKFEERPFSPNRILVFFLWTPRNTTVYWHFCLERIGIKWPKLRRYCALSKAMEIFDLFSFWINRASSLSSEICYQCTAPSAIMNVVYCTPILVLQDFLRNELQTIRFDCFLFYLLSVTLLQFLLFFQRPFP